MRRIISSKIVNRILRCFFCIFYGKQYVSGFYFDMKCMGWMWAFRGLKSRLFGANRKVPWPVHPHTIVNGSENIIFDPNDLHIFQVPGCYWQAFDATITVGNNCYIGPNVGIITTNHDIHNPAKHIEGKPIEISNDCWIGMNSVILPGVVLGPHTVVAAGAVVTSSFPNGNCVIGGVPAKSIKTINN